MTATELDKHLDGFINTTYEVVNNSKMDYYHPIAMVIGDGQVTFKVIEDFEGSYDEFCHSMVELGKDSQEKSDRTSAVIVAFYGSIEQNKGQIQIYGATLTGILNCALLEVIDKRASIFSRKKAFGLRATKSTQSRNSKIYTAD